MLRGIGAIRREASAMGEADARSPPRADQHESVDSSRELVGELHRDATAE